MFGHFNGYSLKKSKSIISDNFTLFHKRFLDQTFEIEISKKSFEFSNVSMIFSYLIMVSYMILVNFKIIFHHFLSE